MRRFVPIVLILLLVVFPAGAQTELPRQIADVKIDQRLGNQVPLKLPFCESTGKSVRLEKYFQGKPVVLVLAYYRCPRLCSVVINEVIESLSQLSLEAGRDFHVVVVSFDPEETHELAAKNKKVCLHRYGRGEAAANGWHFLTGEEPEIKPLADAVGFRYIYDPVERVYKHGAGIMILTPEGKVARYLFGIRFGPQDMRLALVEASENRIGSPVDQALLLTCLAYDPTTGKYTVAVMKLVRLAGILTVFLIGLYLWWNFSWERRLRYRKRIAEEQGVPSAETILPPGTPMTPQAVIPRPPLNPG